MHSNPSRWTMTRGAEHAARASATTRAARTLGFALTLCAALAVSTAGCGGGGGGGGASGSTTITPDTNELPASVTITSVVAGSGVAKVRWSALDPEGQPVAVALFGSNNSANVYGGAPLITFTGDGAHEVSGLSNGVAMYFGLALDRGGNVYTPIGATTRVVPSAPIFVDAASSAAAPDGLTPATAFRNPLDGVLAAFALGGGNVWLAAGTYDDVSLVLWPGIALAGGFTSAFDLASHDPRANATLLRGHAAGAMVEVALGGDGAMLDGMRFDGRNLAPLGIDVDATDAEIRGVTVEHCAGRGMRLRSASLTSSTKVSILACKVSSNAAEGVSVDGAFRLHVEGSRFASNAFEGFDCAGLLGPDNVPVALDVRDCVFARNGQEGLDCDLTPPLAPGAGPGRYKVEIEGSSFDGNGRTNALDGTAGLNVDIDFELIPNWSAEIVVRGSTARANRGPGMRFDLDSTCSALLHRVACTSNGGDGLQVTSESTPSFVTVSASAFVGNGGFGVEATFGQVPVVLAHSVLAGNTLGGATSSVVTSGSVSSVAWQQSTPWSNVSDHFNVVANDPFDPPFVRAAVDHIRALSYDGTFVSLSSTLGLQIGDRVELADDGVLRTVVALANGQRVELDPQPVAPLVPSGLARFENGLDAFEDYALTPTSPAAAAGMPIVGGPVDAGPFGAPLGGAPGRDDAPRPRLFYAASSTPVPGRAIASNQSIQVQFLGGALDVTSVSTQTVRVKNAAGNVLSASVSVQAGVLVITAPVGGWPSGAMTIELHPGLRSTAQDGLATPLGLPFQAP